MNLKELVKAGGFVSTETVEKEVEWEGHKFVAHIRKISFGDYESLSRVSDDGSRSAKLLSQSLFLPDEKRLMTYEEAYQLKPGLAAVLMKAVTDAAGFGDPKP